MVTIRGGFVAHPRRNPTQNARSSPIATPQSSPVATQSRGRRKSPTTRQSTAAPKRRRREPEPTPVTFTPSPLLLIPPSTSGLAPAGSPVLEHTAMQNYTASVVHDHDHERNDEFLEDDVAGDKSDRMVPPADIQLDCGIEEEECANLGEQFGVNDDVEAANENVESGSESEYDIGDDEKIPEPLSSDDDDDDAEETVRNADVDIIEDAEEILGLGRCFGTVEDFKTAVLRYSLRSRYDIKLYRSQSTRIGVKCNDKEGKCEWRCYASYEKKKHMMQVKVYVNNHTCVRSGYSRLLKQGTVAWLFADRLRENPKMTKEDMAAEVKREYNLVVSDEVCAKAKTMLAKQRRQSHMTHFSRVWDYQEEVLQSNEGSTFEIETVPGPVIGSKQRFYRLYVCFKAQRESWKNTCRPIIGLDGAFLKWDIKGHLLAAVGRDGDNRIVPIAWAIVEIENDDNWDWFVKLLSIDLDLGDGGKVAIISDKQKGLIKAIHTLLPQAEHRQCARHILDNWKRDCHDMELQRLFWNIARSYNQGEFSASMDALQAYNRFAYDSLLRTNPATWSRAFFRIGTCCDDVLNNLCESFNRTIKQARRKPILELLEDIRRQCMVRTEKRSKLANKLLCRFTKKAHVDIEKMIAGSQRCTRYMARNNLHEVELGGVGYRVDMNNLTCGCRKWQMTGIPCVHAASVIIGSKLHVEDYVNEFYTTEMWRMTYTDGIRPVQGEMLWPRVNKLSVLPPPWRRGNPGRPSNHASRKGKNETAQSKSKMSRENRVMTCSNCKQEGHNKTTCGKMRVETTSRPRGRPKKPQATQDQASQIDGSQAQFSHVQAQSSQVHGSQAQSSQIHGSQAQGHGSQAAEQDSPGSIGELIRSIFAD